MRMWLLEVSIKQAIENAYANGNIIPNAEQQAQFQAQHFQSGAGGIPRILTIDGSTAKISIQGVLTQSPDFLAMIFGGGNTTYQDIIDAVLIAESDSNITDIEFLHASPGGEFDGLFNTIAVLNNLTKPTLSTIVNQSESAAFALAVQADKVQALNKASRVGSVGVVAKYHISPNEIDITSSNAPNKHPDVTTKEGQQIVRDQIDPMEDIFIDAIAEGRNVTAEKVKSDFGKGATILADTALKNGMIDSIKSAAISKPATSGKPSSPEAKNMKLSELQIQHPDVYAEALKIGTDVERDRVNAHLTMGEASGDMVTALAAIADGSVMTAGIQAKYMAAGMNRKDQNDRLDDDTAANLGDIVDGSDAESDANNVVALVESKLGIVGV